VYDSFRLSREDRFNADILIDIDNLVDMFNKIVDIVIGFIDDRGVDSVSGYLIMLSVLHNEMHGESIIFTSKFLDYPMPHNFRLFGDNLSESPLEIEFIDIKGGNFVQGVDISEKYDIFKFDNEMPSFNMNISDFSISRNLITNYQYLLFMECCGYDRKELWSDAGWRFIKKNNIKSPLYWNYSGDGWVIKIWDNYIPVKCRYNHPISHISWYEAEAFCNWKGCRMITESEWEFIAQKECITCDNNFDYGGDTTPIKGNDIFGNLWEWCYESIYPYDGFVIDPVYREMSYPFFGHKKVCKGGSWACPRYLPTRQYRNSQLPSCRIQYIGFRLAKKN